MPLLDEYRERADEAARLAETATSTGVRERLLQVEAAFRAGMQRVERSLARSAMLRSSLPGGTCYGASMPRASTTTASAPARRSREMSR